MGNTTKKPKIKENELKKAMCFDDMTTEQKIGFYLYKDVFFDVLEEK